MERREIMGLVCGRGLKRAKLKVEGDGAICGVGITELPPNTVGRRQQQKMKIREKTKPDMKIREKTKPDMKIREKTKPDMKIRQKTKPDMKIREKTKPDRKIREKTKPDMKIREKTKPDMKIREKTKPDRKIREKTKPDMKIREKTKPDRKIREKTKPDMKIREKTKPNDVKEMVVGAGSKEDGMVQSAGEGKKLVTWRLSQELMEYIRTKEVMGIMATETPRPSFLSIPEELFDRKLKRQIAAEFKENREFDAYVLYQYRTKGYAEVQEVVTDDEEV